MSTAHGLQPRCRARQVMQRKLDVYFQWKLHATVGLALPPKSRGIFPLGRSSNLRPSTPIVGNELCRESYARSPKTPVDTPPPEGNICDKRSALAWDGDGAEADRARDGAGRAAVADRRGLSLH